MAPSSPISHDANRIPISTPKRRPVATRILTAGLCLLILGAGVFLLQRFLLPTVDAEKTRPVVVGSSDDGSDGGQSTPLDGTADLPDGSVTATINQKVIDQAEHPFKPLLKVAKLSLAEIDANVQDYTATLVSQVFVDHKLQDAKYLECKIRHAYSADGKDYPFAVFTRFLKPKSNAGQEVIWVAGQNEDKLIAHGSGLLNLKRVYLDPDGAMAMKGNRHPIRDIGMRNLLVKMAEVGEKDCRHGECTVTVKRKVDINGCLCSMFEAVHPVKRDHFEFHIARIYIDDQRNIPIAYEGYLWPEKSGDDPQLLEKYYYTDIKLNVGLTDEDFDPGNEQYNYPRW